MGVSKHHPRAVKVNRHYCLTHCLWDGVTTVRPDRDEGLDPVGMAGFNELGMAYACSSQDLDPTYDTSSANEGSYVMSPDVRNWSWSSEGELSVLVADIADRLGNAVRAIATDDFILDCIEEDMSLESMVVKATKLLGTKKAAQRVVTAPAPKNEKEVDPEAMPVSFTGGSNKEVTVEKYNHRSAREDTIGYFNRRDCESNHRQHSRRPSRLTIRHMNSN